MAKINETYKCSVCGNIVEVVHAGKGELVCCGKPMKLIKENTVDASQEKHVPVIESMNGKIKINVGSAEHPMVESHYIEWIELITEKRTCRVYLNPGDLPSAVFEIGGTSFTARAYCNIHGLWSTCQC